MGHKRMARTSPPWFPRRPVGVSGCGEDGYNGLIGCAGPSGKEGVVEVYRDLFIRGSADQVAAVVEEIDRSLADGWSRDRETEERMRARVAGAKPPVCFACAEAP